MSGLFSYREHTDPWFRIGRFEVTTVVFATLAVAAGIIPWVFTGGAWTNATYYHPFLLLDGEAWRLFSWPFAEGLSGSFWSVLTLFLFWYFGSMLEGQIGRKPMAGFLVTIWLVLTLSYSLTGWLFSGGGALMGLGTIELLILLTWIAEYPNARFLFNIPAWVFGAVILAVQVLTYVAYQQTASLLALLLSLAFVAMAARSAGLLSAYAWIPGRRGQRPAKKPRVPRAEARAAERKASDQERMDQLLDQISEQGLHSLTDAQRKELKKLSDRRRQG